MNTFFKLFTNKHLRRWVWVLTVVPAYLSRASFVRDLYAWGPSFWVTFTLASLLTLVVVYTYALWGVERLSWNWLSKERFTMGCIIGLLFVVVSPVFFIFGLYPISLLAYVPALPLTVVLAYGWEPGWFAELFGWRGKAAGVFIFWLSMVVMTPIVWGVVAAALVKVRDKVRGE